MNSVQLIGRLTHDPEPQTAGNGTPLATFRLAVDRAGRRSADFVTVKVWGRLAEVVVGHLVRGRRVAVWGSLRHEEWTTAGGVRRERLVVVASRVEFLDPRPAGGVRRAGADRVEAACGSGPAGVEVPGAAAG